MIFDHIQNKENYKSIPYLYQALCFLSGLEPDVLPKPNTILIPDILSANPVSFTSKPESECLFEAHREYIDIHYIVEGTEAIATADVTTLQVVTPYSDETDIGFYQGKEDGRYYLKPGQFMVCYPGDAHKVGMTEQNPSLIRKAVIKIKAAAIAVSDSI